MILLIWTDPKSGLAKKRILQRDASEGETYCEAIPTTAILTSILLSHVSTGTGAPTSLSLIVGSNQSDHVLFAVTYATSFLTASFGLSKALSTGPCKILPEGRLVSCRFFLIFSASLFTLIGKYLAAFFVFLESGPRENMTSAIIFPILTVLMPGLVTALFSTWHCKMLKTFLHHPSLFILPIFTYLTFSSSNRTCGGKSQIRFSVKASLFNILFSIGALLIWSTTKVALNFDASLYSDVYALMQAWAPFMVVLLIPLPGFILSLIFLCKVPPSNTSTSTSCCSSSCKIALEYGVYKPDHPTEGFKLRVTAEGLERVLPSDDRARQAEELEEYGGK